MLRCMRGFQDSQPGCLTYRDSRVCLHACYVDRMLLQTRLPYILHAPAARNAYISSGPPPASHRHDKNRRITP